MDDYFQTEVGAERVIMMIAEDGEIGETMAGPLKGAGFVCEIASDLDQAIEWLPNLQPDLIILDFFEVSHADAALNRNGVQMLQLLRKSGNADQTPVMFFSRIPEEFKEAVLAFSPVHEGGEAYDSFGLLEKVKELFKG